MSIDPFTLAAQLLNFLVLVGLLRHFLYHPLLQTMDARKQRIAEQMEKAALAEKSAAEWEQKHLQQLREVDEIRSHRLAEVKAEIEQAQQAGLAQVRQEVAEMGQRWKEKKNLEMEAWTQAENHRLAEIVIQTVRRVLSDLANVTLEKQMVEVLLTQSESLPKGATQIFSALPLEPELQRKLGEHFASATFEVKPSLIAGLLIRVNHHTISWSLDSYLSGLSEKLKQC